MGSRSTGRHRRPPRRLEILRREYLRENMARTRVRPASTDPRKDLQDALIKFRRLPENCRKPSLFHLYFPDHPINIRRTSTLYNIPGVEVGDVFNNRAELMLLRVHNQIQAGIDFKVISSADGRSSQTCAVSVVSSGRYEDDVDEGAIIYYTGEGGNDLGLHRQTADQRWTERNLAMKNNIRTQRPIRVIRKLDDDTYSYAGLFKVIGYVVEPGISNFNVIQFQLNKMNNQKINSWVPHIWYM